MSKRSIWVALFCLLALSGAMAGPLEDGGVAYQQGDFQTAFRLWLPMAERGDVVAQANISTLYLNGQGVPKDIVESMKWCRKAAAQGWRDAQFNLGVGYEHGQGVGQDYVEASRWYLKAADQDDTAAQINLGALYEAGKGVRQNKVQALKWYMIAAQRGHTSSDSNTTFLAVQNKTRLKQELPPSDIAMAENMARLWRPMSGMSGQ